MVSTKEVAKKFVAKGEIKAKNSITHLLILGIISGLFIGIAGAAGIAASATVGNPSIARLVNALIFPAGLAMVVIAESELFTGNCLMLISVLEKKITLKRLCRNMVVVYIGNFIGSIIFVLLCAYGGVYELFDGAFIDSAINVAAMKSNLPFCDAFFKGILCNIIVCKAVWFTSFASGAEGKVIALFFPITAFMLLGLEHSIANMSYIPAGLVLESIYDKSVDGLTWTNFIVNNLIPVTIGNLIGGFAVAFANWEVNLRKE